MRLRESGVGCHIDGVFAGTFGYADDILLLAPSLDALRHMKVSRGGACPRPPPPRNAHGVVNSIFFQNL